jgi:hypothetical protein
MFPLIPIYSIFFFGLLIVLSASGSNSISSQNIGSFFNVTMLLFVITSIFGLNLTFRISELNYALKISNRSRYLEKIKKELKTKFTDKDTQADIDLLTYYLSSAIDSFILGDFDRSFTDAFKIIDEQGSVFQRINKPNIDKSEYQKLTGIRNNLSHAKIKDKNKDEPEQVKALKNLEKGLFKETLNILKIVKFELIEKALEGQNKN